MNVKGGTQTWSNSLQRTDFKSDGAQNMSATDKEKYFQNQDLGELLNKVADPNYIDDAKKTRAVGNNELGKDAFMTLLLTQMKNQDPTNPLKSHEMAAQLAQFTSLEKLHNINETVAGLRTDQKPNQNFDALSFIGKQITTDNSKIVRSELEGKHDVRFNVAADAAKVTLKIKDSQGNDIRNLEFKNIKAGSNEMNWNGLTDEGLPAPLGEYSAVVEAFGSNGNKLQVETKTEGLISGVNFTAQGPVLMIGKQAINMKDVKSITDPSVGQPNMQQLLTEMMMPQMPTGADQSAAPAGRPQGMPAGMVPAPQASTPAPTKRDGKVEVKPETKGDGAKRARLAGSSLNDMAMAQGLINDLNKIGAKAGLEGEGKGS